MTQALGDYSHVEGFNTIAIGTYSHAEGNQTIASGSYQHVSGQFNIPDTTSLFIIGNGVSGTPANAFQIVPVGSNSTILIPQAINLNYPDDTTAAANNVPVGGIYHNAGAVRIRIV